MSLIIAAKCKDGIILASEDRGWNNNIKMYSIRKSIDIGYNNTQLVFGGAGDYNIIDAIIINLHKILKHTEFKKLNRKYLINKFIPYESNLLSNLGVLNDTNYPDNTIAAEQIITDGNEIYVIDSFKCISSGDDFYFSGIGEEFSYGYFSAVYDSSDTISQLREKTTRCIESCSHYIKGVGNNITIHEILNH